MRLIAAISVGVVLCACTQQRPPVAHRDFGLAGVPELADTAGAVRALGSPRSRRRVADAHNLSQPADSAHHWFEYPGLALSFTPDGRFRAMAISSSEHSTVRGLRVGDDTARVRRLYGPPSDSTGAAGRTWIYSSERESPSILVNLIDGRVVLIVLMRQSR